MFGRINSNSALDSDYGNTTSAVLGVDIANLRCDLDQMSTIVASVTASTISVANDYRDLFASMNDIRKLEHDVDQLKETLAELFLLSPIEEVKTVYSLTYEEYSCLNNKL
jgi:hypothetical protein